MVQAWCTAEGYSGDVPLCMCCWGYAIAKMGLKELAKSKVAHNSIQGKGPRQLI